MNKKEKEIQRTGVLFLIAELFFNPDVCTLYFTHLI